MCPEKFHVNHSKVILMESSLNEAANFSSADLLKRTSSQNLPTILMKIFSEQLIVRIPLGN